MNAFNSGAFMELSSDQIAQGNLANAGSVTSVAVDRIPQGGGGGLSGKFFCKVSAATGAPTSGTVTAVFQSSGTSDSSDGNWTTEATITLTGTLGGYDDVDVNLNMTGKYIRCRASATWAGGSSPAAVAAAGFVMGGLDTIP